MDEDVSHGGYASVQKVGQRIGATENLFRDVTITEDEGRFLRLAAQQIESWAAATLTFYSCKILEVSLARHAEALVRSAEASDRHAHSLTRATWVLAVATVVLSIVTAALLFR